MRKDLNVTGIEHVLAMEDHVLLVLSADDPALRVIFRLSPADAIRIAAEGGTSFGFAARVGEKLVRRLLREEIRAVMQDQNP